MRGHVKIQALTDFPKRFSSGSELILDSQTVAVEASQPHKGDMVVKLRGTDTRNASEALRGKYLYVSQEEVEPLPPGRYYHFQILDMKVWTKDGQFLGAIKDILSTGSNDVYVVRNGSTEVLIPAIENVMLDVNVEKGLMTVDLPEGLL